MIGLFTTTCWLYHSLWNQSLLEQCQTKKHDKENDWFIYHKMMIISYVIKPKFDQVVSDQEPGQGNDNCKLHWMGSYPSMVKHSTIIQVFDAEQKLELFRFFCTSKFSVQCHFSYYTQKKNVISSMIS